MSELKTQNTTDPSAPTIEEMDAMWLALRREEESQETSARYERMRRSVMIGVYGEAA